MIDRQSLTQLRNQIKQLLDDLPTEPKNTTTNALRRGAGIMLVALNAALGDGEKTNKRVYPITDTPLTKRKGR